MMVTPCFTTTSPGSVSSQLPPCSAAMSTMTLPGFMRLHHLGGDQLRRRLAGDQRGGDDDVDFLGLLGEHLALGLLEALAHHLGVAAAAGAFFLVVDLDELAAQRLDLVGHFGARVVGAHDGAQAGGGADRGQAGDAGADDEDLGRRHLARGGDLAGEEAAEGVGGLDHGAVAGDVGHRGQRVHLLRAAQMRGSASIASTVTLRAASCCSSSGFCAGQMKLTGSGPRASGRLRPRVGARTLKTMSAPAHSAGRAVDDLGAGGAVGVVAEIRRVAGAGLDGDLEAELDELLDDLGNGGDALLARRVSRGTPITCDMNFPSGLLDGLLTGPQPGLTQFTFAARPAFDLNHTGRAPEINAPIRETALSGPRPWSAPPWRPAAAPGSASRCSAR